MQRYDPTTALIVVDLQNDFADPAGGLAVAGGAQVRAEDQLRVESAKTAGASIFYTQDWHPESTPHFAKDGGIWPVHCVADTWGAELHPDLVVDGPIVRKGANGEDGYSGFTMRDPRPARRSRPSWRASSGARRHAALGAASPPLLRQRDGHRRATARVRDIRAGPLCMPVNLRAGDDLRAIEQMQSAGIDVVRPAS